MEQPSHTHIAHFVTVFRDLDKQVAMNNYTRSGQTNQGPEDPVAIEVLEWLRYLANN